jgi:hypothetical protein
LIKKVNFKTQSTYGPSVSFSCISPSFHLTEKYFQYKLVHTLCLTQYMCSKQTDFDKITGRSGILGSIPGGGWDFFLFTTASRTALGPTQTPVQWVRGTVSLGVKRPECEADRSPPASAEVKECVELYLHPNTPSWRRA